YYEYLPKPMQQILKQYANYVPDAETQKRLNKPIADGAGLDKSHEDFLNLLLGKIEKGELNPLNLRTIYNPGAYEALNESEQEAADMTAMNLMSVIKHIQALQTLEKEPGFQVRNLVETAFQMKSKFEAKHGDIYVI